MRHSKRIMILEFGNSRTILDIHKTKDIYISDNSFITAYKIREYFEVGDKCKIFGVEPVRFSSWAIPHAIPKDMELNIIGAGDGYYIMYPKGYVVVINLQKEGRQFQYRIGEQEGKYYYEIWRSK